MPTESQILKLIKEESTRETGYKSLLALYQERVYWQIRRMVNSHEDASDISQEVWIRVFKGITGFKGESGLFTWIYRIATNLAINHIKKSKRLIEKQQFLPDIKDVQSEDINGDTVWATLQKALVTLPEKQQMVFNLRYIEELKYEEISELLGTSIGALKASYHLAVKKIEAYVRKEV